MRFYACMRVWVKKKKKWKNTESNNQAKCEILILGVLFILENQRNHQWGGQTRKGNLQLAACKENNAQYKWISKKKNNNKNTKNTNNKKLKKIPKKSKQEANMQLLCTKYEFKGTKMQRGNVKLQREPSHWRLGYIAFITSLLRLHVRVCLLIRHCLVCSDVVFLTLFAILFVLCLGVFFSFDATKCNFSTLICFACVILYCRVFREFLRYSFLLWAIFAFVGF